MLEIENCVVEVRGFGLDARQAVGSNRSLRLRPRAPNACEAAGFELVFAPDRYTCRDGKATHQRHSDEPLADRQHNVAFADTAKVIWPIYERRMMGREPATEVNVSAFVPETSSRIPHPGALTKSSAAIKKTATRRVLTCARSRITEDTLRNAEPWLRALATLRSARCSSRWLIHGKAWRGIGRSESGVSNVQKLSRDDPTPD